MLRLYITLFMMLLVVGNIIAQQSFSKEIHLLDSFPDIAFPVVTVEKSTNQFTIYDTSVSEEKYPILPFYFLSPEGEPEMGKTISSPLIKYIHSRSNLNREGGYHLIELSVERYDSTLNKLKLVVGFNPYTNEIWAKQSPSIKGYTSNIISNNQYICGRPDSDQHHIYKMDFNGNEIWSYNYIIHKDNIPTSFSISSFIENSMGNIYMRTDNSGTSLEHIGVMALDTDGIIFKSIEFQSSIVLKNLERTTFIADNLGNIYVPLATHTLKSNGWIDLESPIIVKLDTDLNIIWAKKLHAEAFSIVTDFVMKPTSDNGLIFSYSTSGLFPIITGKISAEGELEWVNGYAFTFGTLDVSNDNSIFLTGTSKIFPDGSFENGVLFAKTTPSGEIESCPQFDACLELIDVEITSEELSFGQFPTPFPEDFPMQMDDFSFTVSDFCGTPPPPTADFSFPDTLCISDCGTAFELKNDFANEVRWYIVGPNVDTTIIDDDFTWCFEEAGTYTIEQEVWLLGCAEIANQQVTILNNDLSLSLGQDRTVCNQTTAPYTLSPESNFTIADFIWSTGQTTSTIEITESGSYGLIASSPYCTTEDSVEITFGLQDVSPPYITLPNDTTICPELLPFTFTPTSPYTDSFYINNQLIEEANIPQLGSTTLSAIINGCHVEESILLEGEDCSISVFLPNAFSPNDDGINDFIAPMGEDFEGISLQVFDRWGGLVFETDNPPFRWNGRTASQPASTGVYVLIFKYRNKRNLREEITSGDVLLMR